MALLTGVGDFFRGVFGEDEEEKRRRKQREAQEAAARKQAAQQPRPQNQNQPPKLTNYFGENKRPKLSTEPQKKDTPQQIKPPMALPPRPAPLPDMEFKGLSEGEAKPKTVLGKDVSGIIPGTAFDKVREVKVDRNYKTNVDKYVAEYDTLTPEKRQILVKKAKEMAANGDQAAQNTLKALEDTGRLKLSTTEKLQRAADYASVPGASVTRVGTGIAQGISGLFDLATPGKGTNRVSKGLDRAAKNIDSYAKETDVNAAYKTGNVVGEVASYFIPAALGVKIASRFPKATKITTKVVDKAASLVDDAGDANKVRQILAEGMRKGFTLDEALEEALSTSKYTGENASKGNDTSPKSVALDLATGTAGNVGFKVLGNLFGRGARATRGAEEIRVPRAEVEPFGQVDEVTNVKVNNLIKEAESTPVPKGKVRVFQAVGKDGRTDWVFDNVDSLTAFKNNTSAADDTFRFIDVDPKNLSKTRNGEHVFRLAKLDEDQAVLRGESAAVVDEQGKAVDNTVAKQQEVNAQVEADQAAKTTPSQDSVVEDAPAATSPEVQANNAYREAIQKELYAGAPTFKERDGLNVLQTISPDRLFRENISRPIENKINEIVGVMQQSDNKAARGVGRFFTGFSREAGVTPEIQTARMQLRGGSETGKLNREAIADLSKGFEDDSLNRVWATLDPEFAKRAGMQVDELTPEETVLQGKLKNIIDNTTQENLRRGLITPEQAENESYIKRSYSVYDGNEEASRFERGFRQELLGQYKGRKKVSDEMVEAAIKDPTYLVGKKTAESEAMWAMQDYGNFLVKNGNVSDVARPGWTQLPDSPVFGEAAGKYIPRNLAEDFSGFQYNNAMVSSFNDLITAYDRLGIRQAKKQLLTVFNPAVRLGNQVTNRVIFSTLNGVNPAQFNLAMVQVGDEIAKNSQIYREAVQQGLTGVDISQAEFFANRVAKSADDPNMGKKALDWVRTSYSDADDKARIAAYMVHRNRGYSPEEAARLVQRGFQDYKSVGFFYDMAAKMPVIGNAFVRFASDSVRIAKNAAIDHPLRTMSTVALWSTFVNAMSVASGESELEGDNVASQAFNLVTGKSKSEAQKEREGRFGAPKIPFTDISATVQTPWGEVNVARFMPWYQLNEISSSQVSKFLPFQNLPVEIVDGKAQVNAQAMQDPLLGQLVQLAVDRDFRNKSIRDPEVNPDAADQFRDDPLSNEQQLKNVARWMGVSNLPFGREIDALASAATGNEDLYGKDRSVPQAIARSFGFKVEQQGEAQREKRKGVREFYEEKEEIDREVAGMRPAAQEAYKRLTGYYKLREEVPNEFSPGDTRKKKSPQYDFAEDKWKEYAAHPELYELMVAKKQRDAAKDGKPIQPEFDPRLSEEFRRQLIQNKMVAPGDDAELDQRMYSMPEWDYYQSLKDRYKEASKQYYKDDGNDDFVDELVRHQDAPFPTKPDILKQYSAAYGNYTKGKGAKPEFTDAHKAAKEAYNMETLRWTNTERAARGLPAITWDVWNNPTFGFDESPSGFGFGFGGGGGGGTNTLGRLSNFSADVSRYKPIEAENMPNVEQIFRSLMARGGGGRNKPKLGAGNRGG